MLVLKISSRRNLAQVTIVHTCPEYATESDIVIDPSVSGVTYPIVVQTGMRGVVWLKDMERLIAEVSPNIVDACLSSRAVALSGPGLSIGTIYNGQLEARADFKTAERASLSHLCDDCAAAALEDDLIEFESDEIFGNLLTPSPHADLMMEAIIDLCLTRGEMLIFTLEHVEFLRERNLLDAARWREVLGAEGFAFRMGPLQMLIDRAMSTVEVESSPATVRLGFRELVGSRPGDQ